MTVVCMSDFSIIPDVTKTPCVFGQGSVGNLLVMAICILYWMYIGP